MTDQEASELGFRAVVKSGALEKDVVRLVTHGDLTTEGVEMAGKKLKFVIEEIGHGIREKNRC